jgi:DEAD/DEAH box helicase domain-containing protein
MPLRQVILDVETQKTFDAVGGYFPEKLGVSFVGVIERLGFPEEGHAAETRYEIFEPDLKKLWPILETADVIIGFNTDGFDLPALSPYYVGDLKKLPSLDLLAVITDVTGHRISLDAVAKETLGTQKSGDGLDAIRYFEEKQFDLLAKYCMKDVEITRDIYDYGRQKGKIKFLNRWNNLMEIDVNFRPHPKADSGTQMSLV